MRYIMMLLALSAVLIGCQNNADHQVDMTTPDYDYSPAADQPQAAATIEGRPEDFDKPRLGAIRAEAPAAEGQDAAALDDTDGRTVPLGDAGPNQDGTLSELTQPAPERTSIVAPPGARPYTVAKGDNYWNIATRMLGDGQRWRDIRDLNPNVDPRKLRIGQVILIPEK